MHLQAGAPLKHAKQQHNQKLTRQLFVQNAKILRNTNDFTILYIQEALLIRKHNPTINIQETNSLQHRTLTLLGG